MAQLDFARQAALSRNRAVQVRLCRPTGGQYTAIMPLYVATDDVGRPASSRKTYTAVAKPVTLPTAVIIDAGSTLSTILNPSGVTPTTATSTDPRLGSFGTAYQYVAFQFKPDGSTDLVNQTSPSISGTTNPTSLWFLTVHNLTDGDSLTTPPQIITRSKSMPTMDTFANSVREPTVTGRSRGSARPRASCGAAARSRGGVPAPRRPPSA